MAIIDHISASSIATTTLPEPILFHPLKHHLGYIQAFIKEQANIPIQETGAALLRIGTSQLDFYIGALSPAQIADEVMLYLKHQNLLQPEVYLNYLAATGSHYRTITLSDGTGWVLRWGVAAGRYVHLHPARHASQTIRVKATSLKTAIAVTIVAQQKGNPGINLELVNNVRKEWLNLPPLHVLHPHEGAGKMISLLSQL